MLMRYAGAVVLVLCAGAPPVYGNDFPTRARVEFVLGCMKDSQSPEQESMYKCSCAIDVIAGKMKYAAFVDLSTVTNGMTIAGERGGAMRDLKDGRKMIASFRQLQDDAKKACFITR